MRTLNRHNNFSYLTGALLVLLLALPLFAMFSQGPLQWMTRILVITTLLVTYLSVDFGWWWGRFVLLILFLMVATTIAQSIVPSYSASSVHLVLLLLFFCSVAYSAGHRVLLQGGTIDSNRIIGSIAVYLSLGLVWTMLYLLSLEFEPTAIKGVVHQSWENNFFDIAYFSFVTLTTLGYGDITPAHPASSALAYLEAITGPFYMSVVVASLIGARKPAAPAGR